MRERGLNCGSQVQADITFDFGGNDTLTVTFFATASDLGKSIPGVVTGSAGAYQGKGGTATVTLTLTGATTVSLSVGGSLTAAGPATPASIYPSGIVPVFSSVPIVQPSSWVSIYGNNLANETAVWKGDFPTSLAGVSVTVGGKPAFLWLVSPGQINLQVPDAGTNGCVNVVVTTPNGTVTSQVTLQPAQPSFSLLDAKYLTAEILTPDGSGAYGSGAASYDLMGPANSFPFSTRPVKVGETLVLFGVGFGPTDTNVPAGQFPAAPTTTKVKPVVTVGGVPAPLIYSGLIGPGLYQLNTQVPQVARGDQAIQATLPGQPPLLFSSFATQSCSDPDPQGPTPPNCAAWIFVQ